MPITIGSYLMSGKARSALERAADAYADSIKRLSSGMRINTAADDPAGLAVALNLQNRAVGFDRGGKNINDSISFLHVADSATQHLSSILTRIQELATQAASESYSVTQRSALNKESLALVDEYNRIIRSSTFNGLSVFSTNSLTTQTGSSSTDRIVLNLGTTTTQTTNDGTFSAFTTIPFPFTSYVGTTKLADINGDGKLDLLAGTDLSPGTLTIALGNGDGTFGTQVSYANGGDYAHGISTGDIDGDGDVDVVVGGREASEIGIFRNNGSGTFVRSTVASNFPHNAQLNDLNGDGKLDIVATDRNNFKVNVLIGNGDGTFNAAVSYAAGAGEDLRIADVNGDGKVDAIVVGQYSNFVSVNLGNGDGTFATPSLNTNLGGGIFGLEVGDVDGNGTIDIIAAQDGSLAILSGNGDGTFAVSQSLTSGTMTNLDSNQNKLYYGDLTGDGKADILEASGSEQTISLFRGNGDGTFANRQTLSPGVQVTSVAVGDINGDGAKDIVSGVPDINSLVVVALGNTQTTSTSQQLSEISGIDLTTVTAAREALESVSAIGERVSAYSGIVGANLVRLEYASRVNTSLATAHKEAYSRIMDADMAFEIANSVRLKILQDSAVAVLAQSRLLGSTVLQLLT